MSGNEDFLCVRCAGMRAATCCQCNQIYVTADDVRRIRAHAGRDDFHEFAPPPDPAYLDQSNDPPWQTHVVRADGTRRVLKRTDGRDCCLLGRRRR